MKEGSKYQPLLEFLRGSNQREVILSFAEIQALRFFIYYQTTMQRLRYRINPKTFVITLRQIAKHLKIQQERILNWEKWHNVLWIHIRGLSGYFVSYRKLEQWIGWSDRRLYLTNGTSTRLRRL